MTVTFHDLFRKRLCRGSFRDKLRPVIINNWEATYFDFNEEKLIDIAKEAKDLGAELFVLDDGWFGRRNDDTSSLGDWIVNREKLPSGLTGLAQKIRDLGLEFGLWFEPEMISPNSDLYRAHPDWCLHVPGKRRTETRNQLVLDLSRDDVCDAILSMLKDILASASISYVKWDMNRSLLEVASESLRRRNVKQSHRGHRHAAGGGSGGAIYNDGETMTLTLCGTLIEQIPVLNAVVIYIPSRTGVSALRAREGVTYLEASLLRQILF
jgi:alpha-galactosidase